jgi:agmatinase
MTIEGTHGLWADLHQPDLQPDNSDISVLGIPFDGLASARPGAAAAPKTIRAWSRHLTPFSEDRTDLREITICDLGDEVISNPPIDFERIRQKIAGLPNILIALGGDHSVSIPLLQGLLLRRPKMGVLWLDAHPDLCDSFDGSRLSHACVLKRALDAGLDPSRVCMVGLRSWEEQEIELIESGKLNVYTAQQVYDTGIKSILPEIIAKLSTCDGVYVSCDIDVLDPSIAPGTGIPDHGGLGMRDVLTLLRSLPKNIELLGLDVVEVAPPLDPTDSTVFAALKIIMEFVGVVARRKE